MTPQALVHAGTSSAVPPPHVSTAEAILPPHPSLAHAPSMQDTHMVSVEDPTKETVEVLKNLKPPGFKGENKERNKDIVDTFLSKWGVIHQMRV